MGPVRVGAAAQAMGFADMEEEEDPHTAQIELHVPDDGSFENEDTGDYHAARVDMMHLGTLDDGVIQPVVAKPAAVVPAIVQLERGGSIRVRVGLEWMESARSLRAALQIAAQEAGEELGGCH